MAIMAFSSISLTSSKIFKFISFNNNIRCAFTTSILRVSSDAGKEVSSKTELDNKEEIYDRDPAPYFFDRRVQKILKTLSGFDLKKVYRRKHVQKVKEPKYKFVTDKQLESMMNESIKRAQRKLQMPPILQSRKSIDKILSVDPEIKRFENHVLICTDTSMGKTDRNRFIVVRELDGTLREASWEERGRMNQIFFPREGREIEIPRMFHDVHLEKGLGEQKYEFILNRACIQFEPDDPFYIQVITKTYEHINKTKQFQDLHSTRHFGPMTFYLVFQKKMDNLLADLIQKERIDDACKLIKLYQIIHPTSKISQVETDTLDKISIIKAYAETESLKSSTIEMALQSYLEVERERKELQEGIERAHGRAN